MKTIAFYQYGPPQVLKTIEVDKPEPKDDEVLVKIHATTVTTADIRLRKADPFIARLMIGLFRPKTNILGVDLAGVVEAIGKNVTEFKVGEEVFGSTFDCGLGAYAEFKCLPKDAVLGPKPSNLTLEESAPIFFGGHTALHFLRKGNISEGKKVLIYGASGALGTNAVQLAKYFGAQVTGLCSTKNIELVRSLGASHVIDYTKEDFGQQGKKYDIIFDAVGKSPFRESIRSLHKNGYYLRAVHLTLPPILKGIWTQLTSNKKVVGGSAGEFKEDLLFLKDLIEQGHLKPVIDRTYPLKEIVEAHRYVEAGHKVGNVVITIDDKD